MTEFEKVLQKCLRDLEEGTASLEECLIHHPQHAAQLRPVLLAGAYLMRARELPLSDEFKARLRRRVMQEVRAHPRGPLRTAPLSIRLSIGFAAVGLALLATGTAYAQDALPGNTFYSWKLASESAWRAVSSDPLETDLLIAERRMDELVAVKDNPALRAPALEAYLKTTERLRAQAGTGEGARIIPALDSQIESLKKLGILLSASDPAALPSAEPVPATATPLPASPAP